MGACGHGPVMLVHNKRKMHVSMLTPEAVDKLLADEMNMSFERPHQSQGAVPGLDYDNPASSGDLRTANGGYVQALSEDPVRARPRPTTSSPRSRSRCCAAAAARASRLA
jgi:hypothetical protein